MLDRAQDAFMRAVRNALPWSGYCGLFEYTVFGANPPTYELRPTVPASGLPVFGGTKPDTGPVAVKPGVPGVTSTLAVNSKVLVSFIDCDPARPIILGVAGPGETVFLPTALTIDCNGLITIGHAGASINAGGGFARVLRDGDRINVVGLVAGATPVTAVPLGAFISLDTSIVSPGPPPTGFSVVKA